MNSKMGLASCGYVIGLGKQFAMKIDAKNRLMSVHIRVADSV